MLNLKGWDFSNLHLIENQCHFDFWTIKPPLLKYDSQPVLVFDQIVISYRVLGRPHIGCVFVRNEVVRIHTIGHVYSQSSK